jgi:hypothetical protein
LRTVASTSTHRSAVPVRPTVEEAYLRFVAVEPPPLPAQSLSCTFGGWGLYYGAVETRKPCPSDTSDEEWGFVASYLALMTEGTPQWERSLHGVWYATLG